MLYRTIDSLILRIVVSHARKAIIRRSMSHLNVTASALVADNLTLLGELEKEFGVLDLACGGGRNGLFLARHNIIVTFADHNESSLKNIESRLRELDVAGSTWLVDLEKKDSNPLENKHFDAILVFNYLHRPLMKHIGRAIKAGGLLFYETFTTAQRKFGRPSNPDFLLETGELREYFSDWELLHYFEGERSDPQRAIASLIARKPTS